MKFNFLNNQNLSFKEVIKIYCFENWKLFFKNKNLDVCFENIIEIFVWKI